jgi:hypothetical protein
METRTALGHLALHYRPGDEQPARRLLELFGCTLVDNGPAPGSDGFCTVLLDRHTANHADNIMFLSRLPPEQRALEDAIRSSLGMGTATESPLVTGFRDRSAAAPEIMSHIGLRYRSLDDLERVLADLETAAAPGGELDGRIDVTKYRARPGLDSQVDRRMAASPAFTGDEKPAFVDYWVQCFVHTDLCGFGVLAFGSTFELDFVFDRFMGIEPSFGTKEGLSRPPWSARRDRADERSSFD